MAKSKTSSKKKKREPSERTLIKYKLMIDEWFKNDFNGSKAYKKFHPKATDNTAEVSFSQIKAIPKVAEYIEQIKTEVAERNKVTIDECVSYLAKMMRFKISDLYNDNGALKSIHDIPEDVAVAIAELSTFEEFSGFGEEKELIGFTKKLKTVDRKGVIVELMKYLGGYEKDNSQKDKNNVVIFNIPDNGRG